MSDLNDEEKAVSSPITQVQNKTEADEKKGYK